MTPGEGQRDESLGKAHASAELLGAMGDLLAAVRGVTLRYDTDSAATARVTRDEVADQLSDYILPRLVQFDAPLLTVIGGSTGAGKSTLTNSIVGDIVSQAGVLRPTTRSPVLVHHPDDAEWFSRDRILPDLPRVDDDEGSAAHGLRLVPTDLVPPGLGILDAPDVDSIDKVNRELATQLLAAADLWLFVTSASRYADQVPWEYLKRASDRATSLAVVLDRTADDAIDEVRSHLARMMTSRGLSDSPLFTIPETELDKAGLIPRELVAPIAGWLRDLAGDPKGRRMVVGRTLDGAVRHIVLRAHDIADAISEQVEVSRTLVAGVDEAYDQAVDAITERSTDGSLVGGEVQSRWQRITASDSFGLVTSPSTQAERPHIDGVPETFEAIVTSLRAVILDSADLAADQVGASWSADAAGRVLLESDVAVDRASTEIRVRSEQAADDWRRALVDRTTHVLESATPDADAPLMCLCVAVEALSASPGPGRAALDAVIGDARAQDLIEQARHDLVEKAASLLSIDRARLSDLATEPDTVEAEQKALRNAARSAEYARHNDFVNGEIAT